MFFPNDTTTEIVAHFLGYFELAVEAMRIRLGYEQIEGALAEDPVPGDLEQIAVELAQKYALGAYQPGVEYLPPGWIIRGQSPIEAFEAPTPVSAVLPDQFAARDQIAPLAEGSNGPLPLVGTEPGSIIAIMSQAITLLDDDLLVLGTYDGPLVFHSGAGDGITMMHAAAEAVSGPVTDLSALDSVSDAAEFVTQVGERVHEMAGADNGSAQVNTVDDIDGNYLNGDVADALPDLMETLPAQMRSVMSGEEEPPETNEQTGPVVQITISGDEIEGSVTLSAGGNLLVNNAAFVNGGLTGAIFAVDGDLRQLDVIIQTNAYFDLDNVGGDVPGAGQHLPGSTMAINAAAFLQEVQDATGGAAEANPGVMPTNWQVSVVSGDMVFIEWLSQFTFSSDQDMTVLSSTGTQTVVTSGENVGLNTVSFANLGLYYDLIIVGGSIYDANIIVQTNVLYDNDTIQMLGEGSAGTGSLSTSGNLLWNQASIQNVGPTSFVDGLPDHYGQAMSGLEDGDMDMPSGFGADSQFEGFQMLRVLYIAGDVYDLRYVEQTNILGDADMVALQRTNLLEGDTETEWTISTGTNALVNIATIKDVDALGDTAYVGGEIYSDAILIQADIIAADGDGAPDSDTLVTEVIAFLEVDVEVGSLNDGGLGPAPLPADGPPADIIQSVLA